MVTEGYGPYKFLNTCSANLSGEPVLTPNIVLRVNSHLEWQNNESYETNEENYHGGLLQDEAAALLSLSMGIRCKAGGRTREFSVEDLSGLPIGWDERLTPVLRYRYSRALLIPAATGTHSLDDISILGSLPLIEADTAGALIKAARLYQEAMWVCESEPEQSWLLFVSAIETAANFWKKKRASSVERLCAARLDLEAILLDAGGQDLLKKVASQIADFMGATNKFLEFMLTFLPEPPSNRPMAWAQHSWDDESWSKTLRKIYDYRSRALHAGIPFPAPMCFSAVVLDDSRAEKPIGIAGGIGSYQWNAEDTPLHLHMFEYLVRGVLINWWRSLSPQNN